MKYLFPVLMALSGTTLAAEMLPNLPPTTAVIQVLRAQPLVQAADSQIQVETANRKRLEAGNHEWSLRLGGQQRKATPNGSPNERFTEWNAALESPLRLPGKAALDAEIGNLGVSLAETAHGDTLHESSRNLLKAWFVWLRETASATQWREQSALLDQQGKALKRRLQLGDTSRLEQIQAEAAQAQAQAQLAQARTRQRNAHEDLRRRFPGLPLQEQEIITAPEAIDGTAETWINAILEHNHELALARGEAQRAQSLAGRSSRERVPDPTVGVQFSRERSGEENVMGAYISIPLPGSARLAASDASRAQVAVASSREAAVRQRIEAEAVQLHATAVAAIDSWQASRIAAEQLTRAAEMTARSYQLGEGSLSELLASRRLANEAVLAARLMQLEALELRYRLMLDAHRLWDFD
ncbi:TolC family protein [Dechloromonas denitrificans]|uniref:TolC family protein n=1 Tax=Dechloromonas denitrificans TaxID=281362 RepID=UPI001CF8A5F1|nr:TolC family protein [Dechloromonas denitrificans]UCV12694.1 TolC family protein [Dechloromonas denitrificans]